MKASNLLGMWKSSYTYSKGQIGEHQIQLELTGNNLLTGKSDAVDGNQLILSLEYDEKNNALTGTWYEVTARSGHYKGAVFHGSVQFILNLELTLAQGKWVGFNREKTAVNADTWSLTRV